MTKNSKPNYLAKVKLLTKEETERLLSRMGGKLPRRIEKRKISQEEALAMQLELEDGQLHAWRKVMHNLNKKDEAKEAKKAKKAAKAKVPTKAKAPAKAKVPTKAKAPAKVKVPTKAKAPAKVKAPTKAKALSTMWAPLKAKVEPGI
jgi:hypothetical protein